jgi:hypothetical protein
MERNVFDTSAVKYPTAWRQSTSRLDERISTGSVERASDWSQRSANSRAGLFLMCMYYLYGETEYIRCANYHVVGYQL